MKRFFCLLFTCLIFSYQLNAEQLSLNVKARGALLMNVDTGAILYEKNAHTLLYPASTTKLLTSAYIFARFADRLGEIVEVPREAVATLTAREKVRRGYGLDSHWQEPDGTTASLKIGEKLSVRDLMYGAMLPSGNDADNALAYHLGDHSMSQFMEGINAWLRSEGCLKTHLCNSHGLFDPNHQTSAFELGRVVSKALKNPQFRELFTARTYRLPSTNKQGARTLAQTCRLVRNGKHRYANAIGGKTGTLSKSGYCMVSAAEKDGRTLLAVVLGCKTNDLRYEETIRMFEKAFAQKPVREQFYAAGKMPFELEVPRGNRKVLTMVSEAVDVKYYPSEKQKWKAHLVWDDVQAPIVEGDRVGEIQIMGGNGAVVARHPLYAFNDVPLAWWAKGYQLLYERGWARLSIEALALLGVVVLFAGLARQVAWTPDCDP